jgi:RHS repeat-associated protein
MNRLARYNGSVKNFYVNDIRGSVVAILDTAGTILDSYTYEPFGSILTQTGSGSDFNYTGKEFDEGYNFNLYYYGARYYNAELGRFISPDPVRGYYNPYSYVGNEPVMRIDPDGKASLREYAFSGLCGAITAWGVMGASFSTGATLLIGRGASILCTAAYALADYIENHEDEDNGGGQEQPNSPTGGCPDCPR